MFYLCSMNSKDVSTVFGSNDSRESVPPKYPDLTVIMLGQKKDYTKYLFLTDQVVDEFTRHNSVPEGYEFIFRQEWGLIIDENIIHRVIETLRKESYPPMSDYLDAIVKNDSAQLQKYLDDCLAVKTKYPKFQWKY